MRHFVRRMNRTRWLCSGGFVALAAVDAAHGNYPRAAGVLVALLAVWGLIAAEGI